ncbi:hypothetical protein H6G80_29150 [Nostoc sp. FACHB-87]|uniref:LamG domain-containing protein n=1 Tax=Nostocaceae TaxID=1162 RepID=UPI001688B0B6|nr:MULTISPECIES: LamG domain-containing protein [Nostocaceae]MBD2458120.1 hypothetical protein [Nostoc sp. FACHB-87]MBD2479318.1 hypothetical protein [Anabaena sp. FACHB-83]
MQAAEKLSKIVGNSDAWILSSAEFQELATELLKQGLVAHYPFNGNADDSSGHGLHGTVYGATLTKDRFGNPNSAYQFDGIDDYIEIAHNDLLNLTDNFTISLWINQPEDNSLRGYRLIDKTTAGVNDGYNFDTYDGSTGRRLRLTGGKQNVSAHTTYSLNEWHHVAVVFSKGVSTFYLDGNLDGSGQHHSEAVNTNSLTLKIGAAHNSHTEFFKGVIDDVRIYNRALSEKDIQELYEFPTALRQCVLEFNGQNNYVSLPAVNIDYSQGFSVEAWVRYNSFKYWSRIIDFGNGVSSNNIVFANPETTNQLALDVKTSAGERRITSAAVLETGKWTHLAATIDQSGFAKLYKNGELIQSGQLQLPANINRTQNYIGRSNWPQDGYFDGQISEVRVWNIARSQAEIQQHLHSRLAGNEDGLVGYWQLNECSGTVVADKTSRANNGTVNGAIWQQQELLIKPAPATNLEPEKAVEPAVAPQPESATTNIEPEKNSTDAAVNLPNNSKIKLQSWKGDYLHRPDSEQGVTTWGTGIGNEWLVESVSDRTIRLKSWKGDYLHRPDSEQGVTTWGTGVGNEWLVESVSDRTIRLKSWKGDYLHRPDSQQGVTTWGTGIGNEWNLEVIPAEDSKPTAEQVTPIAPVTPEPQPETNNLPVAEPVTPPPPPEANNLPVAEPVTPPPPPEVNNLPVAEQVIPVEPVTPPPPPETNNLPVAEPVIPPPPPETNNLPVAEQVIPVQPITPPSPPETNNLPVAEQIKPVQPVTPPSPPETNNLPVAEQVKPVIPITPPPRPDANNTRANNNQRQTQTKTRYDKTDLIVYLFLIVLILLIAWQLFKPN